MLIKSEKNPKQLQFKSKSTHTHKKETPKNPTQKESKERKKDCEVKTRAARCALKVCLETRWFKSRRVNIPAVTHTGMPGCAGHLDMLLFLCWHQKHHLLILISDWFRKCAIKKGVCWGRREDCWRGVTPSRASLLLKGADIYLLLYPGHQLVDKAGRKD